MRTYIECMPCFMNQLIRTGKMVELDDTALWQLMKRLARAMESFDPHDPPPKSAVQLYDLIANECGCRDPFEEIKKRSTRQALGLYEKLKRDIEQAPDPLEKAIRFSACGNVIDFGVASEYDLEAELESISDRPFAIWHMDHFRENLKRSDWVLYLGDNAGESVFDRLLIEILDIPVTFVVRDGPIINDVTEEDAEAAGIGKTASITSSGCRAPGTILEWCSSDFLEMFNTAPLIISKGQGNYETLAEQRRPIYFILKAKCNVVSRHLKCNIGDMIFAAANRIH